MITREFNLYLHAGHSIPLVINVNQYDHGEQWLFKLFNSDGTQYTPSTGAIVGIKSDGLGIINSGSVDAQGRVVINETQQMTAAVGKAVFELVIDDGAHGTANFVVLVEPKPGDNADLSESDISMIAQAVEAASTIKPYGSPLVASTVAGMTDHEKVYVYVGSETGYTSGNWYYWDGSAWTSGGVYNSVAVQTDTTLTLSGVAADSKKTGDEINDLKSQIAQGGVLSEDFKTALEDLVSHIGTWTDGNAQTYISALHDAMNPTAELTRISAVYTQGGKVYSTDPLDTLKTDLVVTAYYSDLTSRAISSYTLSGSLNQETSTITVSYSGMTDTFDVTVTLTDVPYGYRQVEYIKSTGTQKITTGVTTKTVAEKSAYEFDVDFVFDEWQQIKASNIMVGFSTQSGGWIGYNNGSQNIAMGTTSGQYFTDNDLTRHSYHWSASNGTATVTRDNNASISRTLSADTAYFPLYVFSAYNGSGSQADDFNFIGKLYDFRLYQNGNEIMHLIPCYRISDGEIGVYDIIGDEFHGNIGTGVFLKGDDI